MCAAISGDVRSRVDAMVAVARHHGIDLDRRDFVVKAEMPPLPSFVAWLNASGLWAKAARLQWRQLFRVGPPLVLLFDDGGTALLVGQDAARGVVLLKNLSSSPAEPAVEVD